MSKISKRLIISKEFLQKRRVIEQFIGTMIRLN